MWVERPCSGSLSPGLSPGTLPVRQGSSSLRSFHVGSDCPDPQAYAQSIADARLVFEMGTELGHRMHILDLGGSFPGVEGPKVRFEEVTHDGGSAQGWEGAGQGSGGTACGLCLITYPDFCLNSISTLWFTKLFLIPFRVFSVPAPIPPPVTPSLPPLSISHPPTSKPTQGIYFNKQENK